MTRDKALQPKTAATLASCPTGIDPATDLDGDCVEDALERTGYDASLDPCTPDADDPGCFVTDPTSWSSDGDPYSDFQEATGVNMDNTIEAPFNGPLVAAVPRIEVFLLRYRFAPTATITDSNGQEITSSDTQEFSVSSTVGVSVTTGVEAKAGIDGGVTASTEVTASLSVTAGYSSSQTRGESLKWETATATDSDNAAILSLDIAARNSGSATALDVTPTFNLFIGDEPVGTITPSDPFPSNLRPNGEQSDFITVSSRRVGNTDVPLSLTIGQLRRLQSGAPITIEVIGLDAGISRWRPEDSNWSCPDPCRWEEFQDQIEARTLRLLFDFGYSGDPDAEIPRRFSGNPFEYRVFTGSPNVSPNFTLRNLLGFIGYQMEQQGGELLIEGRPYPSAWHSTSGPDKGGSKRDSTFFDYWDRAGRPGTLLDMVMPRGVALLMASPDPVDPGPVLSGERFGESMRGLTVAAAPKGSIPVDGGEAYLVFTGGREVTIPLERVDGTNDFSIPDSLPLPIAAASSYVVVRDILGNERTLTGIAPSVPTVATCADVPVGYYREPRFDDTEVGTRDGVVTLFVDGDLDRPATVFCYDDGRGGDFWYPQVNDMGSADVTGIAVLDLDRRVAVGDRAILRSDDGGLSWSRVDLPEEDLTYFRAVSFREGTDTGVAVGDGGIFLRTDDGGITWERAVVELGGNYHDVDYAGADTWYAVGESRVRRSTDDGRTWAAAAVRVVDDNGDIINEDRGLGFENLTAVSFISDSVGVIGDHLMNASFYPDVRGRVFETRDGGETWRHRTTFTRLNDITFDGDSLWYVVGRNTILRIGAYSNTVDEVVFAAPSTQILVAGSFATPGIGFVQSEGGVVYRTDDGGQSWISPSGGYPTPTHPGENLMRDIHMLDANIGASVGTGGVIGATDAGGGVPVRVVYTGLEDVEDGKETSRPELPVRLSLDQNYPNPFNPSTTITYRLEASDHVRLEVFDVTGRRVAVLVDGAQSAGAHEMRFNASGLASGVYVYRLSSGSATEVRTMLLLR